MEQSRDQHERAIVISWHTGAFAAAAVWGKLPELRTVLARVRGTDQSHEDMKQQILALSRLTGFPVKQLAAHGH